MLGARFLSSFNGFVGNKGNGRTPLNWETRAGIAVGAARAISYLHSRDATTSHGNIKSSNILLSDSYEAKVSDYGLAPIISSTSAPNRIDGYRAPEVTDARKISQKADVYSFGVLILELLTGNKQSRTYLSYKLRFVFFASAAVLTWNITLQVSLQRISN